MGVCFSSRKIPGKVYRYLSAITTSLRLSWLGLNCARTEMKTCQFAFSPNLMNASAVEEDIGLEEHIREGAEVSCGDERCRTALHVAAGEGYESTVRFLLQQGADVNAIDRDGVTPLRDAIRSNLACLGEEEEMKLWKKAGISFNVPDAHGRTPLNVAVYTDQPEMMKFCISNGSDLEQRDRLNNRPVDDAQRLGLQHLEELLRYQAHRLNQASEQ